MSRIIFSSSLAAALALAGAAGLEFQTVKSESGRFTAQMPGQPKDVVGDGGEHTFDVQPTDKTKFRIAYMDFDAKDIEGKDPQVLLKAFRDGLHKRAKIKGDKAITLGADKIPGREYRLEIGDGEEFARERAFLSGTRFYVVSVSELDDKDYLDSKDADMFFDSFAVTK